jgi:type I restriction enzyme S subunit
MSFRGYPDYKSSGFDWMGEIPFAWFILPLKRAFEIIGGSTPSADEINWGGPIQWATPADLSKLSSPYIQSTRRTLSHLGRASCGCSLLPTRSIILSTRAPIGSLAINTEPMSTNQGCKGLVPYRDISSVFFAYVLSISTELLNNLGKGTTFLEISGDELGRFPAAFPTFPEQTQIARFLDHETAKIDTLIHEQKRLIELLKEKRQAVISHAVTKGLDPDVPMKDSGVEWLGEVPAHWGTPKLSWRSNRIGDGLHSTPEYEDNTGYYFVNGNNLVDGSINLSSSAKEVSYEEFVKHQVELGPSSVFISINGTIGNVAIYEGEPIILGKSAAYINCDLELHRKFLLHYLKSGKVGRYFDLEMTGTTIFNLSLRSLRHLKVSLPPMVEQEEIVKYLDAECLRYDNEITVTESLKRLLIERRSTLISAAVTGKIDVRDWQPPTDESFFQEVARDERAATV